MLSAASSRGGHSLVSGRSDVRVQAGPAGEGDVSWTQVDFDDSAWFAGTGAVGYSGGGGGAPGLRIVADACSDWLDPGVQGARGWVFGYYLQDRDADGFYDHSRDFANDPAVWGFEGGAWVLRPDGADEVAARIGRDSMECLAAPAGRQVWAIRRWLSRHEGGVVAEVSARTPVRDEVPAILLIHNGQVVFDSRLLRETSGEAVARLGLELEPGDVVDVACVADGPPAPSSAEPVATPVAVRFLEVVGEAPPIADSLADWGDAAQGENGWEYGVYHFSRDADRTYAATDFVNEAPEWNLIDGSWQLGTAANPRQRPPWDRLSRDSLHPGVYPAGVSRWILRRWTSDHAGPAYARVRVRKQSRGGNGVTARVFRNGAHQWSYSVPGHETGGIEAVIPLGSLEAGDVVDFAVDPMGTDGIAADAVDGSFFSVTVHPGVLDLSERGLGGLVDTEVPDAAAPSVLLRYPFVASVPEAFGQMALRIRYQSAFTAWLNGVVVAEGGVPGDARPADEALVEESFDLSGFLPLLEEGPNVLAIQGHAPSPGGEMFVFAPRLVAGGAPHAPDIRLATSQPLDAVHSVAGFVGRCTDPDGGSLAFVTAAADASTHPGASISVEGAFVRYSPPPGFVGTDAFTYVVADDTGATASGLVVVEVAPDAVAPLALSAGASPDGRQIVVRFSEPMDAATAGAVGSFTFDPPTAASITGAELSRDGLESVLSLDRPLPGDGSVRLMVSGAADRSGLAVADAGALAVRSSGRWPNRPDPSAFAIEIRDSAIPAYHAARFTFGEWLGTYSPSGDYLNTGRWIRFTNAVYDEDGVPLYPYQGFVYNPTRVELHCLSRHGKHVRGEESPDRFLAGIERLLLMQDDDGAFRYPFDYVHHFRNTPLSSGWSSCLAQGFGLSALSRAYLVTGDDRFLEAGAAALDFLLTPVASGGPATTLAGLDPSLEQYVWFEEWPVAPVPYTLNGFTFTLLGLHDWSQLDVEHPSVERAREAFRAGLATLEVVLPWFDLGGFTVYDLRHFVAGERPLYAWAYHGVHVGTVHALRTITGSPTLHDVELLWASFVERPMTMHVESATAARIGETLVVSAHPEYRGAPVPAGTAQYSDVMGDVLQDGLPMHLTMDGAFGTGIPVSTDRSGRAAVEVPIPARFGMPGRIPLDVTFDGWGEYQPCARRVMLDLDGSGAVGLQAKAGAGYVKLEWAIPEVDWNAGYRVYRAESPEGPFVLLNASPLPAADSAFVDGSPMGGGAYFYRLTTVGLGEGDSDFSPLATAAPGPPPEYRLSLEGAAGSERVRIVAEGIAGERFVVERSTDGRSWELLERAVASEEPEVLLFGGESSGQRALFRVRLDP